MNELDLFGNTTEGARAAGPLGSRFIFPPFTVLRGDSDTWLSRKAHWLGMGIKSEVSREDVKTYSVPGYMQKSEATVSVFDPCLAEVAYRWFCPTGGQVVDPFAGGSVRGIVASFLGLPYWGCDLREEQVQANREQAAELCTPGLPTPVWVTGDALVVLDQAPEADLLFSCPPYGDLEVYSEDGADLSTMPHEQFLEVYAAIIKKAVGKLRVGGMAAWVVGEFRDKRTGAYREFVPDTVAAFTLAGLQYWNEVTYMTPVGTLAMRTSAKFETNRKLGKNHQNMLVFTKGRPMVAGIPVSTTTPMGGKEE